MRRWIQVSSITFATAIPLTIAMADKPASQPAASQTVRPRKIRPSGPPVIGVRLDEPLVAEYLTLLEVDEADDGVRKLRTAVKTGRGRSLKQLNELRLGLAIALVRTGKVNEARKLLLPLIRLKQPAELARAAGIIHEIALRHDGPKERDSQYLCGPVAWGAEFTRSIKSIHTQVRREHDEVARCLSQRRWAALVKGLDKLDSLLQRAEAVDAEAARLSQRDLFQLHAAMLGDEVRRFNVAIADLNKQVSQLSGQMTMRSDAATRRRGYLPADAVYRYNAAVDELAGVVMLGERCVAAYQTLAAAHAGDIKKDATVKISRAAVPSKRTVFSQ